MNKKSEIIKKKEYSNWWKPITLKSVDSIYAEVWDVNNLSKKMSEIVTKSNWKELIRLIELFWSLKTHKDVLVFKKQAEEELKMLPWNNKKSENINVDNPNYDSNNMEKNKSILKIFWWIILSNLLILWVAYNIFWLNNKNIIGEWINDNSSKKEKNIKTSDKKDINKSKSIEKNIDKKPTPEEFIRALKLSVDKDLIENKKDSIKETQKSSINKIINIKPGIIQDNSKEVYLETEGNVDNKEDVNFDKKILNNNNLEFYKWDVNKLSKALNKLYSWREKVNLERWFNLKSKKFQKEFIEIYTYAKNHISDFNQDIKNSKDSLKFLNTIFPAEDLMWSFRKYVIYILWLNKWYIVKLPSNWLKNVVQKEAVNNLNK